MFQYRDSNLLHYNALAIEHINNRVVQKVHSALWMGDRNKTCKKPSTKFTLTTTLIHESYPRDLFVSNKSTTGYLLILIFLSAFRRDHFPTRDTPLNTAFNSHHEIIVMSLLPKSAKPL